VQQLQSVGEVDQWVWLDVVQDETGNYQPLLLDDRGNLSAGRAVNFDECWKIPNADWKEVVGTWDMLCEESREGMDLVQLTLSHSEEHDDEPGGWNMVQGVAGADGELSLLLVDSVADAIETGQ
jgi:hypothetical protein